MIMKQLKLKSFMLGMMLLVTASASAYDFTVDGKYYNILDLNNSWRREIYRRHSYS